MNESPKRKVKLGPNDVDIHVGKQMMLFRKGAGLSQTELANQIGISFQQVQKYEKGKNRVSAGKLFEIAQALSVSVSDFFDETANKTGSAQNAPLTSKLGTDELAILHCFNQIRDTQLKKDLVKLIKRLVE